MQQRHGVLAWITLCLLVLGCAGLATAQVNTGSLSGAVLDQQGLGVHGAKVTVSDARTGAVREVTADDAGHYKVVGLTPGRYKVSVDGGSNFAPFESDAVVITVGEDAGFDIHLTIKGIAQTVTVTTETAPIETTKTEVSQIVGERSIDNLPINGRNYINFTLTNSQTTRDVSPTIGPAPNSGLNVDGARGRSNMVSVDGADAGDNAVDGIRSTVSQEAVQEFQLILSNYNAEYGRATGGVVNIVTKSGANEIHGDIFGYFRNKAFQARNAFSGQVDPVTGVLDPVKQAYTRTQSGFTFGGPLKKDKTFYFLSYEYTQREETGFSSIGIGNFGMVPVTLPPAAGGLTVQLTGPQATAVNSLFATGSPALEQLAAQYAVFMGSASSVALNKVDFGAVANSLSGGTLNPGPGAQFPIPASCPPGQTVNSVVCSGFAAVGPGSTVVPAGIVQLPGSFVGLNSIRGNYPVSEKTSLWSGRIDQRWSNPNTSFIRVGVSPSDR